MIQVYFDDLRVGDEVVYVYTFPKGVTSEHVVKVTALTTDLVSFDEEFMEKNAWDDWMDDRTHPEVRVIRHSSGVPIVKPEENRSQWPHTCRCGAPGIELFTTFECSSTVCAMPRRAR